MKAKFINEKFEEETDPIQDMGIGTMSQIKKAFQDILNLYGTGGQLEEINSEDEYGYMAELIFKEKFGGTYYITYTKEDGWLAGYEGGLNPYNIEEVCEDLDECVNLIDKWIEYAMDQSEYL